MTFLPVTYSKYFVQLKSVQKDFRVFYCISQREFQDDERAL